MDGSRRLWLWVGRGSGGVLATGVKLFRKRPVATVTKDVNGETTSVRWDDPDDRLTQPNTVYMEVEAFYQWFGFIPDEGVCSLYALAMKPVA